MKSFFIAMFALGLVASSAIADEMPSWWRLPNQGRDCVKKAAFLDGPVTCGTHRYETWLCVTAAERRGAPATASQYLLVGEYVSDVGGTCSPTYVVRTVAHAETARP